MVLVIGELVAHVYLHKCLEVMDANKGSEDVGWRAEDKSKG